MHELPIMLEKQWCCSERPFEIQCRGTGGDVIESLITRPIATIKTTNITILLDFEFIFISIITN